MLTEELKEVTADAHRAFKLFQQLHRNDRFEGTDIGLAAERLTINKWL